MSTEKIFCSPAQIDSPAVKFRAKNILDCADELLSERLIMHAINLAKKFGITLIGRMTADSFCIYTNIQRIVLS